MSETSHDSKNPVIPAIEGLTLLQMASIEKLMTAKTLTGAARAAKVSESAIHNWLKQPLFRRALGEAYQGRFELLNIEAIRLGREAFATLETVMTNPNAPAMARVQAASRVLEAMFRSYDLVAIQQRLDSLEARIEGTDGQA